MKDISVLYKRFGLLIVLVLLLALVIPVASAQGRGHGRGGKGGGGGGGTGAPEINVRTGFTDIPDNTGFVAFNDTYVGRSTAKSFVVENLGDAELTFDNVTVPNGFTIQYISGTSIGVNGIASIDVRCNGTSAGTFVGTFSFTNNDADENPYDFTISCFVTEASPPEMDVFDEANRSAVPDGTGSIIKTGTVSQPLVEIEISIENNGNSNLYMNFPPSVPPGFSFHAFGGGDVLSPGGNDIYFINCPTGTAGTFSGMVSIENNDPDENPYDFMVTCIID